MSKSVIEQLKKNRECEHLLDCLYGLNELDKQCYQNIVEQQEPTSVQQLVDSVDRDKSTIHRSLDRLVEAGLISKERETYDSGGYQNVYTAVDSDKVVEKMKLELHEWYTQTSNLISEFEDKYN